MNLKKIAMSGALSAALVASSGVGAVVAGAATNPGAAPATCLPADHDGSWPGAAAGRPARDPGVRVWHDATGWHVRVTHNTLHDRVFSGVIRTTGEFIDVHAVRLEKNDYLVVGADHHSLAFRFNNYGGTDGFDFYTKCAPYLGFLFASDGHVMPTARISIGEDAHHPLTDPFRITRTA
ncbi:MAG: hypothetical protein QOI08_3844 [Actinomycetota bacterium]|jgi:hypothetical protein|nr:hypothetical protein [Actinomycetota bacterium]